jgi:hypothetical protein
MIEVENGKPEGYNDGFWKPANANGYSKHSNGGGLVSSKAKVAATAYVGPDAVVNGGTISGNAVVRGRAFVSGGSVGDDAVLEEDAWLVSGTISGKAKVGALSVILESFVKENAQVYGVMWPVEYKVIGGTAQLRGDLENSFSKELSKGVFYGMIDDGMLNNASYGANLTTPPTDATASIEYAKWYAVADDSAKTDPGHLTSIAMKPLLKTGVTNDVFGVYDLNGKYLGTVNAVSDVSSLKAVLRDAGFNAGVYFIRSKQNRKMIRVNAF